MLEKYYEIFTSTAVPLYIQCVFLYLLASNKYYYVQVVLYFWLLLIINEISWLQNLFCNSLSVVCSIMKFKVWFQKCMMKIWWTVVWLDWMFSNWWETCMIKLKVMKYLWWMTLYLIVNKNNNMKQQFTISALSPVS